ncbi:MAG: hypothetical protein RIC87_06465 [Kiloniellales bacterium]
MIWIAIWAVLGATAGLVTLLALQRSVQTLCRSGSQRALWFWAALRVATVTALAVVAFRMGPLEGVAMIAGFALARLAALQVLPARQVGP